MSSTRLSLHCHVIFSTKNRRPLIAADWRARFHACLGGAIRTLDVIPEAVGGVADHVHLLIGIRATHRLADVTRDVKRTSSAWVHETIGDKSFAWQDGYGAFWVSVSLIDRVKRYIENQEEHHRKKTFEDEYVVFLKSSAWNTTNAICGEFPRPAGADVWIRRYRGCFRGRYPGMLSPADFRQPAGLSGEPLTASTGNISEWFPIAQ